MLTELILFLLLWSSSPADSPAPMCECFLQNKSGKPWPEFRYDHYDVIFAGQVRTIEWLNDAPAAYPFHKSWIAHFDVEAQWKGERKERMEIVAPRPRTDCEYPFKSGKKYMVYAEFDERVQRNEAPILRAWICDFNGTGSFALGKHQIPVLDSLAAARGYIRH